jgi:TIR domain
VGVSTGNVASRIFMSYRREETAYPAGWLYDRLVGHFGRSQVFKDVDSIELGDDFVEVITGAVASCDVLLALIGDRWLTITDTDGRRRLDNANDFVRLEIEAALARDVRVIPVLVEGARMPNADELPASMAKLVRRQALELSPSRFDFDTQRLLRALDRTVSEAREQAREPAERAALTAPDSTVAEPDTAVPEAAEPDAAEPDAAEPVTAGPDAVASEPETAPPKLGPGKKIVSVLWALLPTLTFGLLTPFLAPIPFVHAAAWLRDQRLWWIATAYGLGSLALWIPWFIAVVNNWRIALIFYFIMLAIGVVASIHAFMLRGRVFAPPSPPTPNSG